MGYRKGEGWDRKEGLLNNNAGKNLLSYISQSLFSGKHATTYKYCFLKSLLDNLYSFDNEYRISFKKIGQTFVEIYWNMIVVHQIPQMPNYSTGERTFFEKIIEEMIAEKPYLKGVHFYSIREEDKELYIKKAVPVFSNNVIGAFYEDSEGMIYGFSKKDKCLWLNACSYKFLSENKTIIEQANYYQWLKMIESILKSNGKSIDNLSTILECITQRSDLSSFKKELSLLGEEKTCFYCGKKLGKDLHLDHLAPWDFLKSDDLWNFVFSCSVCNISKSNRIPDELFVDKLIKRNEKLGIKSPNIKEVVDSAKMNGVKSGWKPKR
ncbi:MAG TPA: HNH endonuclease [Acholeplasmataceae bacterium]|nr:HNH endonuclease [Acholeplasmataceae bacterium]